MQLIFKFETINRDYTVVVNMILILQKIPKCLCYSLQFSKIFLCHTMYTLFLFFQIVDNPGPLPLDLTTMKILPQQYCDPFGGDQSLLYDSGDRPCGRMLMFSTQRIMKILAF